MIEVKDVLKILGDFGMIGLFETLLYREKRDVEEWGDPTSSHYDRVVELLNLVPELS